VNAKLRSSIYFVIRFSSASVPVSFSYLMTLSECSDRETRSGFRNARRPLPVSFENLSVKWYNLRPSKPLEFLRATAYMLSAHMLSQFRLSVRPSVRLSVRLSHGWISQKRLKLGSCNFHHTVAPSL